MSRSIIRRTPIQEIINDLHKRFEENTQWRRKSLETEIARLEQNFQVVPMLDAAGIDLDIWDSQMQDVTIQLGEIPPTKKGRAEFADKLRTIRKILGSRIKLSHKYLQNGRKKLIGFALTVEDYPGINIRYYQKLPKDSKCRIEKRKSKPSTDYSLVCSL